MQAYLIDAIYEINQSYTKNPRVLTINLPFYGAEHEGARPGFPTLDVLMCSRDPYDYYNKVLYTSHLGSL